MIITILGSGLHDKVVNMNNYVLPALVSPQNKYFTEVEVINMGSNRMPHVKVSVYRRGDEPVKVYEYVRNYGGVGGTFEPFRQLQDGVWHDYALISPDYTRFEVVDLESGKVVAKQPYGKLSAERAEALNRLGMKVKEGDDDISGGFCPMTFYVPDVMDLYKYYFIDTKTGEPHLWETLSEYRKATAYSLTGQFALYGGCYWGDDSSEKLRYIDLSKIKEGIVTADERFGYVEIFGDLKQCISFDFTEVEEPEITVTTKLIASLKTGQFLPEQRDSINWGSPE